ncbi:DUF6455 family protein [Cognatishimia sp. MH4019]|uniref:DUF6455 family protein n=1 Tax=Cognatishimia sp. MH4019 TaxID=2854030 RepID=UPI001CD7109C|nr:DUF6455 family protein [Cognatishimia sp. MH4019]
MAPLGNPRTHFWLTLGMAKATGVDLNSAFYEAKITRSDYSGLINRCRGCTQADTCGAILGGCMGRLENAPEFCLNRTTFEALAA